MNEGLKPLSSGGWSAGMGNLLERELSAWFRTSRWWKYSLGWMALINGMVFIFPTIAGVAEGSGATDPYRTALEAYLNMAALVASIGVVLTMQDAIIGERESGTLAWVMSHPVSRTSFLLAKAVGGGTGLLLTALALPALLAYWQVGFLSGQLPEPVWFLAATGMVGLQLVFYLSLMLLLGVVFQQRLAAAGLGLAVLFAGPLVPAVLPALGRLFPWQMPQMAMVVAVYGHMPSEFGLPLLATALWAGLFLSAALWQLGRMEL